MAGKSGFALKTLQWFLRAVEFGCAAVILALFSYFLAKLSSNNLGISNYAKAIEGISGAGVLYTILAVLFVCCLGGLGFFALVAFVLDILFVGGFIFIAIETRHGANSCTGFVQTPLGDGIVGQTVTYGSLPSLRESCRMTTACFAVSIVAAFFFLISAAVEILLWRHHKSEKKYGPSPSNNYTTGSGNRKFWQRKRAPVAVGSGALYEKNPNSLPVHSTPSDVRQSYATDNTMVGPEPVAYNKYGHVGNGGVGDGYAAPATGHVGTGYNETARLP